MKKSIIKLSGIVQRYTLSISYRPVFFLQKLIRNKTEENLIKFTLNVLGIILSPFYYLEHPPKFNSNNS